MDLPPLPADLATAADRWQGLTRGERIDLGRSLRRLGWSYGEIRRLIPVPQGTLAGWCRYIGLTDEQTAAIRRRTAQHPGVPRDTQRKRRAEVARLREAAHRYAEHFANDPAWIAGVALYWGEGAKTQNLLALTNSDVRLLRLFTRWVCSYIDATATFVMSLHLHEGADEGAERAWWAAELRVDPPEFYRTQWKQAGTGHRRTRLAHGVCRVHMRRSADALVVALTWIDWLADHDAGAVRLPEALLTSRAGR